MVFTASLLGTEHKKKGWCGEQAGKLAWFIIGQGTYGTPPSLCGRQVAYPYFTKLQLWSCSPSVSLEATLGYPPIAVRLVGGGAISHSWLVRNGLSSFSQPKFNDVDGMNLHCRSCRTSIPRKRRGSHNNNNNVEPPFVLPTVVTSTSALLWSCFPLKFLIVSERFSSPLSSSLSIHLQTPKKILWQKLCHQFSQ